MKITLPDDVKQIIETLEQHGYEGYAVGGCVRDSILGRIPNDWDITTSATPQQVKKLFPRTVDTGIQHGTVTVLMGKEGYEVTTYRVDGEYEDARHPKEVTFTANLEEDLRRRDFTINAMAYNDSEGLVDVFGGRADIEQKVIRCVGNAEERFGKMHCVSCVLSVFRHSSDLRSIRTRQKRRKSWRGRSQRSVPSVSRRSWSNCWFPTSGLSEVCLGVRHHGSCSAGV